MKAFYATGTKGSYLELEDGRYADTVTGDFAPGDAAISADQALEIFERDATDYTERPVLSLWAAHDMAEHVGA